MKRVVIALMLLLVGAHVQAANTQGDSIKGTDKGKDLFWVGGKDVSQLGPFNVADAYFLLDYNTGRPSVEVFALLQFLTNSSHAGVRLGCFQNVGGLTQVRFAITDRRSPSDLLDAFRRAEFRELTEDDACSYLIRRIIKNRAATGKKSEKKEDEDGGDGDPGASSSGAAAAVASDDA